jgi:hypothetical protein
MLTRDDLNKQASVVRYGVVTLAIGQLCIRSITERERNEYEGHQVDDEGQVQLEEVARRRARLVCLCAVGEDHRPLFSKDEFAVIEGWDAGILTTAYEGIRAHCGLDASKARVEAAEKNSEATPDGGSA